MMWLHAEGMLISALTQSYVFDIFLGPNYNQGPPSVKYVTVRLPPFSIALSYYPTYLTLFPCQTGGGKFRFNPNLYNVGRCICG
jgi:hypothetical protein